MIRRLLEDHGPDIAMAVIITACALVGIWGIATGTPAGSVG